MPKDTTRIGNAGEQVASEQLVRDGFKILARNWRHPLVEIDIIAEKCESVYICEVKFRSSQDYGGGVSAIGKDKIRRLKRGAEIWRGQNRDYRNISILVIEIGGANNELIEYYDLV